MRKPRLPRQRRVAPDARPGMRLMERDLEIVKTVNDCRALLGGQIEALFFGSRSTCQYRLSRLYQHEFLDRHFLPIVSGGPASSPTVYTVGKRGVAALVEHFDYGREDLRRPSGGTLSWQFLEHLLKINDVRVAVLLAARREGWTVETWQDETVFRSNPDYVLLTDRQGRTHQKPVLPDGYFSLVVPQGKGHCFLEVDRGTEQLSKFRPQMAVYETYTRSGGYQARYSKRSLRVLVVTTSATRLKRLMKVTRQVGGDRKYWFTTFDRLNAETVLTQPIWQRLDDDGLYPLVSVPH